MRTNYNQSHPSLEDGSYRELRLLEEVEFAPEVSQRRLALRLGIALGVANLLVRSLAKKGYIRAARVGWKRWVYVLTPAGVARKFQLTLGYVDRFLDHYRRVRLLLEEDLGSLGLNAESCIAIYGTTELTELMYLVLKDMGITSIDVYDADGGAGRFLDMPVRGLESLVPGDYFKVLVAFPSDVESRSAELAARGVAPTQIVTLLQNSNRGAATTSRVEEG